VNVLFIQTGGTIDKGYPKTNKGYAFEIVEPAFLPILKRAGVSRVDSVALFKKDSTEITDSDRSQLKKLIKESEQKQVVVTHGSDTLIETARFVGNIPGKTIVFTAAFLPEAFKESDADFNLGMAVGVVQTKNEGTYICMQGEVFLPNECIKHKENGKFQYNNE